MTGIDRYISGKRIVLKSESWEEAEVEIQRMLDRNDKFQLNQDFSYYKKNKTLWNEYQFLFLIQLVEHSLGEFLCYLYSSKKIKPEKVTELVSKYSEWLDKYKSGMSADELDDHLNRINNPKRIFTPYSFSIVLRRTSGDLISMIDGALDFVKKDQLSIELKQWNNLRNDFIHRSFGNTGDGNEVLIKGIKIGRQILDLLDELENELYIDVTS